MTVLMLSPPRATSLTLPTDWIPPPVSPHSPPNPSSLQTAVRIMVPFCGVLVFSLAGKHSKGSLLASSQAESGLLWHISVFLVLDVRVDDRTKRKICFRKREEGIPKNRAAFSQ